MRAAAVVLVGLAACADGTAPAPAATDDAATRPIAAPAITQAALPADGPPDFDAYLEAAPLADRPPPPPADAVVTSIDPRRGTPRVLWTADEPPPAGTSEPVNDPQAPARSFGPAADLGSDVDEETPARAALGSSAPAAAARRHLTRLAAAYRLDAAALATVLPTLIHDTGRGPIVVRLGQRVAGLEVWPDRLAVVMRRDLSPIALFGGLAPAAGARDPTFTLTADDAARAALRDVGVRAADLAAPAHVRPVLYALPDRLVPAYLSEIRTTGPRPRGWRHLVAADDGRLLRRQRLDADDVVTYRVWADPAGDHRPADGPLADVSPHPTGLPDGFAAPPVEPSLVALDGLDVHGDPWLAPGAGDTRGNNVDAFADLTPPTGYNAGDLVAPTTAPLRFDARYDLALDPNASSTQHQASITQLFFTINWLHDYFYDSGFVEAAGNAQDDNLGRGGAGGDRLVAEGQDYGGFGNANMFTPEDGTAPRMQVYLWASIAIGGPRVDGSLDNTLVAHEWGHYLHHRLVDCTGNLCSAMSEGWGDFNALLMMLRPPDDLDGAFAFAPYATAGMYANAAYFGLRRYPYSHDLTRAPLTLRHVRNGEPLPAGVPFNPLWAGNANFEPHNAGELWASALFDALLALAGESRTTPPRYSLDDARRRMADYVVAGMIATPSNPTLTEQRDAILAAAATDVRDLELIAGGFAHRGLGSAAVSPPANSAAGLGAVESFTVSGRLGLGAVTIVDGPVACDADGQLDAGEVGVLRVALTNRGAATLHLATVVVTAPSPGVEFPASNLVAVGALAPFEQRVAELPIRLAAAMVPSITFTVELHDPFALPAVVSAPFTVPVNRDLTPSATDDLETAASPWTATAGWTRHASSELGSTLYSAATATAVADERLVTPPMTVASGAPLRLRFRHRYTLAAGDGAVVEYTRDGQTWLDVATLTDPGYGGPLAASANPLAGRPAYSGASPDYPALTTVDLDLGTALAGATIRVRFRLGTDDVAGAGAWDLDDVAVAGVTTLPFVTIGPDDGHGCDPPIDAAVDAAVDAAIDAPADAAIDAPADAAIDGPTDATPADAAPAIDAARVDAGAPPPVDDGGCCRTSAAGAPGRWLAIAAALGLLRRRRRPV